MRIFGWIFIVWISGQWGFGSANFPPITFLTDFQREFNLLGTVMYVPLKKFPNGLIQFREQARTKVMQVVDIECPKMSKKRQQNVFDLHVILDLNSSALFLHGLMAAQSNNDYWLISVTGMKMQDIKHILDDFLMDLDDQIYLYDIQDTKIILHEAFKVHATRKTKFQRIGYWTNSSRIQIFTEEIWQRRADLEGIEFKIATLYSPPYITAMIPLNKSNSGVPENYALSGMFADVFFNLKEILNFTFVVTKPPDGNYGAVNNDRKTWTGMVGMLHKKEIDMAITDFTVTVDRSLVISFAEPITEIYHSLFIKNPTGTPHYTAYVEPLNWMVWGGLAVIILITPPILHLSASFGSQDNKTREITLWKSYAFIAGILTSVRPRNNEPSSLKAKITFLSLLVGGTLIFWHWEAMLISYLSTRVLVLPFENLQGVAESSDFKISLTPGTAYMDAFKLSRDPTWQRAWKDRIEPNLEQYPKSAEGHTENIIKDTSLVHYDNYFAINVLSAFTDCEIIAIPAKYDFKPYAYGFQKNSPYLGLFNHYLKQLRERGSTKKILEKYDSQPQVCPDYSGKPLGLNNCFTAFVCLALGLVAGLILLAFEKTTDFISEYTGCTFDWLYLNEEVDRREEDLISVEDANFDLTARLIVHEKSERIRYLEEQLKHFQNGPVNSRTNLFARRRRKERMV